MSDPGVAPEYKASIGRAVAAIEKFATSSRSLRDDYKGQANGARVCPAITELAHQSEYVAQAGDQPVDNLASMVDLLIQAGTESLRAVGTLINTEPVFVWAHLATGRAALEAFALTRWLAECPLDRETRVKRGLLMSLEDACQLGRYGIPEYTNQSSKTKAQIRKLAEAKGWAMSIKKRSIGGETLIDTKPALDRLFGDPDSIKSVAPKFWSYLSGASHGYPYALVQAVDREGAVTSGVTVTSTLVVRAKDVHNLVAVLILGAIRAPCLSA